MGSARHRKGLALTAVVLLGLGGIAASGLVAMGTHRDGVRRSDDRFQLIIGSRTERLAERLRSYESVLLAERGAFELLPGMDLPTFRRFHESLDLDGHHPGMQGLGWQVRVSGSEIDTLVATAREARPDFAIKPAGTRDEYYIVLFNEPASRLGTSWGFDARENPTIRPYLERAIDCGCTTLSAPAVLGVDLALPEPERPVAFGMFVPVYRSGGVPATIEERRSDFLGWASSPFRAQDFLDSLAVEGSSIGLRVRDQATGRVIGASPSVDRGNFEASGTVTFGGREWLIDYHRLSTFPEASPVASWAILLGGSIASVAFGLVLMWALTRARQEAAVAAARDEAVEASRLKSDFLATMSHEIRTPMNGVIGLTELLLDTELTGTQRQYAEGVQASGEALLGIINDILDFSKIEAGKLKLETIDFDLAQVVEDVAGLVAESARSKGLELVTYCSPDVPTAVRGDAGRLRQILLNFATNAVKFTDTGEVVIRVGLPEEQLAEQVVVHFEVIDTGIGIDPDGAERIFESFIQGDASTTRRHGGTGLGLAICRRLGQAMNGSVGVESQPGRGSTFWLRLPLAHASAPSTPPPERRGLEGLRALVVDDNETSRSVLGRQLESWGASVDVAPGGQEALMRLRVAGSGPRPYDLGLVDRAMPGMDGLELAGMIASDPRLGRTRLLLLGCLTTEYVAEVGVVACTPKPVRPSKLYDALVEVMAPSPGVATERPSLSTTATFRGTLLIVEDNAVNREVARGLSAGLGYESDVAANGIEALRALGRRSYDAVLMDCNMPEMDGFEATAAIRSRESGRSHVPIVAMTAGALAGDREKCIAAGMDDYLAKPVKGRDLETVLSRWLGAIQPNQTTVDGPTVWAGGDGVLDDAQFDALRQLAADSDDPVFLQSLVSRYLDESASQVADLREAAARSDALALGAMVHALKGTSVTIGARRVASACASLEDAASRGEAVGPTEVDRISGELDRASAALRARTTTSRRS